MKEHVFRLTKGQDLYKSILEYCKENNIESGIAASAVGCVYVARVRDATGINIETIYENLEIVGVMGTVSKNRLHLHISLSKEDLSVIGGHLVEGTFINTTCEIVILELDSYSFDKEFDENTGYNELKIIKR